MGYTGPIPHQLWDGTILKHLTAHSFAGCQDSDGKLNCLRVTNEYRPGEMNRDRAR